MNTKKFCFIICTNSEHYFQECIYYINRLSVPDGYEVEVLKIPDAKSITAGYNEGMNSSDAKYKIYMHQDVFIVYTDFLQAVLDIFNSDKSIGMIGMVGAEKCSPDGVMWNGYRCGNLFVRGDSMPDDYHYDIKDGLISVEIIDGLMMITSKDIPWREDLFTGWDFYDVSQSLEMRRKGYSVVVPEQKTPWCVHDDGILNMKKYNHFRKVCLKEYAEFFDL